MVCQYTNTSSWCVLLSNFWLNSLCEDNEFSDLVHKSQSCQPPVRERDPLSPLMEALSSCLVARSHSRLLHQIASSSLSSLQHRWVDARKENLITVLNLELLQQWELGNDLAVFQVHLHHLLSPWEQSTVTHPSLPYEPPSLSITLSLNHQRLSPSVASSSANDSTH